MTEETTQAGAQEGRAGGRLTGSHVVVVGGSSGMGLAVALGALRAGAAVSVIARSADRLAAAADLLKARHPTAVVRAAAADAGDEAAITTALAGLPPPTHVYVSAGSTYIGGVLDGTAAEQFKPIDDRLRGAVYVVRACVPRMAPGGSFVFTGGLSSDRPVPGAWVSGVGTRAAEQLARVFALDLAPVRFNAVSPGWTDTPMWDHVLGGNKDSVFRAVAEKIPVKRLATADEVADAVLFLMTNGSVTGEVLHVDGGQRLT